MTGNIYRRSIGCISTIDKKLPIINSLTSSSTVWTNQNVVLTGTAEDDDEKDDQNTGIRYYQFTTSSDEPVVDWIRVYEDTITQTYTATESGTYYFWVRDRAFNVASKSIDVKIDKNKPTITSQLTNTAKITNSATMSIGAMDELSGFSKVEWYYKKSTESAYKLYATDTDVPINSSQKGITSAVTKTKTIDNLETGTYNIKAKVYDVAGNSTESSVVTVALNSVPTLVKGSNVTFTATPTTWTQGPVSVKVTTNVSGYTIQVSGDNKNWQNKDTTSRALNGAIYVRLTDGTNVGGVASYNITNIDPTSPTVTLSQNGGKYVMPTNGNATIKTKITAEDTGGSGLSKLQYGWSQSNTTPPTSWSTFTNGQEIIKSDITTPGTWYLWTNVTDVAGNRATTVKTSNAFVVGANTESVNNITFNLSTTDWTNKTVTVTPVYGANLVQNKTLTSSGTAETDYTINEITKVIVKTNGITITATAQDIAGNTVKTTKTITNIDKQLPKVKLEPDGGNYIVQDNTEITIKTRLIATDVGGSDVDTLQYAWSQSNTTEPTEWENTTNNQEIRKTGMSDVEKWYLWTKVTDKAGNINIEKSKVFRFVKNESEFDTNIITYNYSENGGTSVTQETGTKKKGEKIDLSIMAQKDGYEFIGWNTNKNATTALNELTMGEEDITLYAIFKKDITLQFVDYTGTKQAITTKTLTIYNKNTAKTTAPLINEYTDWKSQYWTTGETPDASKSLSSGEEITNIVKNATYYARYTKTYTITFDLNGGQGSEIKEIKNNVEVNSKNINVVKNTQVTIPQITSTKEGYKPVCWNTKADGTGVDYVAGEKLEFIKDMTLYIRWNKQSEDTDEPITIIPEINIEKTDGWTNKNIPLKIKQTGTGTIKKVTINGNEIKAINNEYNYEIKENNTYIIEIEDEKNNTIRKEITITSIDKTAPVISDIKNSSKNEVQTEVVLELKLEDEQSGIAKVEYSYDGSKWNDCIDKNIQKDFVVTSYSYQAGESAISMKWTDEVDKTIYFRVTDNIGNVSEVKSATIKLDKVVQDKDETGDKEPDNNNSNITKGDNTNIQSNNAAKDNTIAKEILPKTGDMRIIVLIVSISILIIIAVILIKKYKFLKEIIK